ncbi:hypothetical protein [Sandaracinobacteroides saxicola]|uniref:GTPase n=1 Tax=Sandaracinobacteroides saxicola TaxID=2759707 RepID=A0A7G5IHX7_9SPHN|nr:hypothetical protein [Sandaracinobacteroides saxicola]QMW22969.1 hypothetical protein H3309_00175 [Sandaracinobacteroides saxicola]
MTTLRFVYNADGGLLNGALDLAHKWLSPSTYACRLCEVSYSTFGMKPQWRAFVESLGIPVVFHHRDDFAAAFPNETIPLPAILRDSAGTLETLVSAQDFAQLHTLDDLIATLRRHLGLDPEPIPRPTLTNTPP